MDREECSRVTDTDIDQLLQDLAEHQRTCQSLTDAPQLRMAHDIRRAYQTEARDDAHSLERVLAKLREDQAKTQGQEFSLAHVTRPPERISTMQHRLDTLAWSKSSRKWLQPAGMLAATLFLTLLIGGLLTMLGVIHIGQTAPTARSASQVVTSVALSANSNQMAQASTTQTFTVGQTIWLTSMINMAKMTGSGVLTVKWYENNRLFATATHTVQIPKEQAVAGAEKAISVRAHQVFTQPGDGKVEVYWNGQLIETLHFSVK